MFSLDLPTPSLAQLYVGGLVFNDRMHPTISNEGDTMTDSTGKEADATAAEHKRKTLKRALKGTVGVGLTAASAVLLAHSHDIGDWLQSVAPHVLPHTGAGADIVLRAIAEAKSCVQEGANVCLDAEGKVTALCKPFLGNMGLSEVIYGVMLSLSSLLDRHADHPASA